MQIAIYNSALNIPAPGAYAVITGEKFTADDSGIIEIPNEYSGKDSGTIVYLSAPGYAGMYTRIDELADGVIFDLDKKPNYWPVGVKAVGIAALIAYLLYQANKA